MEREDISFSFGENWEDYLKTVSAAEIERAKLDIQNWLGDSAVAGKSVLDIGSGSGIHSYCYHKLGATSLFSFDYDRSSVSATSKIWHKADEPDNWKVSHGSILDKDFLNSIGQFDIVYSWGVLHHTGSMWEAIENSLSLVAPNGKLWIALYSKGPQY